MVVCDTPGLQVMDSHGEWRQPALRERDLLLMAGDALEATTAGVIRPAVHRVGSTTGVRHSAAIFIFVGADAIDLHRLRSLIVREDEEGRELGAVRIENHPMALAAALAEAGPAPEVGSEATCGWY